MGKPKDYLWVNKGGIEDIWGSMLSIVPDLSKQMTSLESPVVIVCECTVWLVTAVGFLPFVFFIPIKFWEGPAVCLSSGPLQSHWLNMERLFVKTVICY